ncbi:hypothetical protein [Novosphingobium sp. FSW06-99]|uniref:hypothetical protein n=1 Tax=Novosphingobium sp. FSW06-99 TaxID=1739113 RepID=UPI00076C41E4|nr:hypothetical protein [Novosphingobium sp. FSW06-99]KUR80788.1 hypothetical protein AQZ49_01805 [Novosphingobium sp. FSW06-99]
MADRCPTCIALLEQSIELSHRAQAIDEQCRRSTALSLIGCVEPTPLAAKLYDADFDHWQQRVTDHLAEHADHG